MAFAVLVAFDSMLEAVLVAAFVKLDATVPADLVVVDATFAVVVRMLFVMGTAEDNMELAVFVNPPIKEPNPLFLVVPSSLLKASIPPVFNFLETSMKPSEAALAFSTTDMAFSETSSRSEMACWTF